VAMRSSWREMALALAGLVLAAALAEIVFSPRIVSAQVYGLNYDGPYGDRYQANIAETISLPFGDLVVADPAVPASVIEPRRIKFLTDSLGYRNRSDYTGQKVVLVGDSMVVGKGTDQEQIIPELFTTEFPFPPYPLGFLSSPREYEARARTFLPRLAPSALYAFMFFDGNDL